MVTNQNQHDSADQHDSHVIIWRVFTRHGVLVTIAPGPLTSARDIEELTSGRCPDCGCTIFRPGPRGGLAQNIECAQCKSRFNVARWQGHLVTADRIENNGEWREDLFPRVLE